MPTYDCADCAYVGEDYTVIDDGSVAGRAVCPDCEGQLTVGVVG